MKAYSRSEERFEMGLWNNFAGLTILIRES